jgi:hypothetical protein
MPYPDSNYEAQWRDARNGHMPPAPCGSDAWWVQDNTDEPLGQLRVDCDEECVCVVGQNTRDWTVGDDRRRMAHLIAAAPELLRALKHLLSMWEEAIGWEKDYMDMGNAARAAIAKAEGRASNP